MQSVLNFILQCKNLTCQFQKSQHRLKICQENNHRDPHNWSLAQELIDSVGNEGMSGEETDSAPNMSKRIRDKRFIVNPVKWMNPELRDLFRTIDTYEHAITAAGFSKRSTRGPISLERVDAPEGAYRAIPTRNKISGLARNYYDNSWYQTQNQGEQMSLNADPIKALPSLVCSISYPSAQLYHLNCFTSHQRPYQIRGSGDSAA